MNSILLIVGKSGSGKTTIEKRMERELHTKPLRSYTTREKRHEKEEGHIFIRKEDVDKYRDRIAAYTKYNNNEYFATIDQINECDTYVVDVRGAKDVLKNYQGDREVIVMAVKCPAWRRLTRMIKRGDGLLAAIKRILIDSREFKDLREITDISARCIDDKKFLYRLDIKEKDINKPSNSTTKQAILRRFKTLLCKNNTIPHQDNLTLLNRL